MITLLKNNRNDIRTIGCQYTGLLCVNLHYVILMVNQVCIHARVFFFKLQLSVWTISFCINICMPHGITQLDS